MEKIKRLIKYFTPFERCLWLGSAMMILLSFLLFGDGKPLAPIASAVGVTSLILCAKGNPLGQLLIIFFAVLYGIISYGFAYYGEMITYLGMTAPMALFSLVSWLKNPYEGNRAEVKVNRISGREMIFAIFLTAVVTMLFFFILKYFHTANLFFSTLSVATSFAAVYLTFRRSPWFAAAYAANDTVLIILWVSASMSDTSYIPTAVCFAVFLVNDVYGFISWRKMESRQKSTTRQSLKNGNG